MSFLNKIFQTIPVKIPDRSGFDLSHEVLSTAKVGTVTPVTYIECLPGDTISMGSVMKVTLPPMAVPFMGRIDAELTAAFIPNRLLWQGWQSFITQNNGFSNPNYSPAPLDNPGTNSQNVPYTVPLIRVYDSQSADCGPGTLADYLGYKSGGFEAQTLISAMPFLAYHKFVDDWVRDENNMKPFFPKAAAGAYYNGSGSSASVANTVHPALLPYSATGMQGAANSFSTPVVLELGMRPFRTANVSEADLSSPWPTDQSLTLGGLRQRCWAKDYFTTATTRPQAGAAASVIFDTSGETGNISIASIRAANSLQKWMERNNIAGTDYGSQIVSHFGVTPPDAVLQRSVLLGSVRTPVYVGSVENNTGTGADAGTRSPFGNTLGAAAGFASAADKGRLVDDFTCKEHGILMVFFTLIPHAYYATGIDRQLLHTGYGDFAWPEFANIGDQEIRTAELTVQGSASSTSTPFGYNQRYSEYKFMGDRIAGELRDGQSLDVYALQRSFDSVPDLGKDFLTIPTDYLDQVTGVDSETAEFGCMIDAYFDVQALRILPEYSLPSL